MDVGTLIDAIVRQTTVMIAQLATSGGTRTDLAHTANQVFLDLVAALRERGLGSKVIADMFGMALRTYHQRVQRLGESRTERGKTLWEAVFDYLQQHGPVARTEVLRRFARDDEVVLRSLLKDLVGSGLVYRTGRGDHVRYHVADEVAASDNPSAQSLADLVSLTVHRTSPASLNDVATLLSIEPARLLPVVASLLHQGRLKTVVTATGEERYTSMGCVIPLGEPQGWEVAVFDHYQAMVTALCTKLRAGRQHATAMDTTGGSTFSYTVWEGHPHYEEATSFLARFRQERAALREKIADYNRRFDAPEADDPTQPGQRRFKVLVYAGQSVQEIDPTGEPASEDCDDEDGV